MEREEAVDKPLHNSILPLSAEELAVALTLTGQSAPTPTAFAVALQVMYPVGDGPTVKDVLAAGQLVYTTDGQCPETLLRVGRIAGVQLNEKGWGFRHSVLDAYPRRYHRAAQAA